MKAMDPHKLFPGVPPCRHKDIVEEWKASGRPLKTPSETRPTRDIKPKATAADTQCSMSYHGHFTDAMNAAALTAKRIKSLEVELRWFHRATDHLVTELQAICPCETPINQESATDVCLYRVQRAIEAFIHDIPTMDIYQQVRRLKAMHAEIIISREDLRKRREAACRSATDAETPSPSNQTPAPCAQGPTASPADTTSPKNAPPASNECATIAPDCSPTDTKTPVLSAILTNLPSNSASAAADASPANFSPHVGGVKKATAESAEPTAVSFPDNPHDN